MAGDGYRVGVLGATGAVGSTILEVLGERGFPATEVIPFSSERSAGVGCRTNRLGTSATHHLSLEDRGRIMPKDFPVTESP